GGCAARAAVTLFVGAGAVESARWWGGEAAVDWVTSVTAARSGNPSNMNSPVVSPLDDGNLKKVVSGSHRPGHSLKDETSPTSAGRRGSSLPPPRARAPWPRQRRSRHHGRAGWRVWSTRCSGPHRSRV